VKQILTETLELDSLSDQFRLWQRNSPAAPENSAALYMESLKQFVGTSLFKQALLNGRAASV
jgi:hypothetical protein